MTALVRYQAALLLRSQRWLPPILLYAAFLAVGIRSGEPVLGALGYTVAPLLPVTAWLVRTCLNQEPPAVRHVAVAAAGRTRVHLAAVLAGTLAAAAPGGGALLVVVAASRAVGADGRTGVPLGSAALAGLLAALVCLLLGAALGTLLTRPLLPAPGWSTAAITGAALLALVLPGSPANTALTALVTGDRTATVTLPVLAAATAAVLAAAAVALACRLTATRE
ncbi:ABC transporter [Streptomyces sp. NPDC015131]|uniref:ABC transporter n=1 Tax=Streptomyces sp. NPDC015131 TaxID=3364941 RepID=UPI0037003753